MALKLVWLMTFISLLLFPPSKPILMVLNTRKEYSEASIIGSHFLLFKLILFSQCVQVSRYLFVVEYDIMALNNEKSLKLTFYTKEIKFVLHIGHLHLQRLICLLTGRNFHIPTR